MLPDPSSRLWQRLKHPEYGMGLTLSLATGESGTGTPPSPPPDISPNLDWRPGIASAFASDSSTTFSNALVASGGTAKTWPSRSYGSGTWTDTVVFSAPITANGGCAYYLIASGTGSTAVTAQYSLDTTNGSDGTWNNCTVVYQEPNHVSAYGGGRMIRFPAGTKGYRQTLTTTVTTNYRLKFHQFSATGRDFVMVSQGSSIEASCWGADLVWREKQRLEAAGLIPTGLDPILFDYTTDAGTAPSYVSDLSTIIASDVPEGRYATPTTMCGVELRTYTPYANYDPTIAPVVTVTNATNSWLDACNAAGVIPIFFGPNYRDLRVNGTHPAVDHWLHQENGVLPGEIDLLFSAWHTKAPDFWDSNWNMPKFVAYPSGCQRWWYSDDGVHFTDQGYNVERRERCYFLFNWLMGLTPSLNLIERIIASLATRNSYWNWQAAYNCVYPLPASSKRTTCLNTLASYESAVETDLIKISLAGPTTDSGDFEPNWNLLTGTRHNTLQTFYDPVTSPLKYTDGRSATGYGFALTAQSGTASFSASGGGPSIPTNGVGSSGYDEGPIPDLLWRGSYVINSGASRTFEVTVPDAGPYTVRILSSHAGSVAGNTTHIANMTVNGVNKTQNPGSADTIGNEDFTEWTGVVPSSSKITIVLASSGGSTAIYQAIQILNETAVQPTLGNLGVDLDSQIASVAWTGNITGVTAGTTNITATSSDATTLTCTNIGGDNWTCSGTFTAGGTTPTITFVQTHPTATNSGYSNGITFTVLAEPTLVDLALDNLLGTVGIQFAANISNHYVTSGIAGVLTPPGSTTPVVTAYPDVVQVTCNFSSADSYDLALTETLAGATNSPHTTHFTLTISASSGSTKADSTAVKVDNSTRKCDEG